MKKERIDVLLVQQGFFETREKAKRSVMAGLVLVNQERIDKPGEKVAIDGVITVKGNICPYVSRGGLKLKKAIDLWEIDLTNQIVIDIGASTGGFTDCSLQHGAKLSYAIDVGYNQLDWKMREDERVISMERTNFRYVTLEDLPAGQPTFSCIDVSFISLKLILPVLRTLLAKEGQIVALIKPQFEAGREQVGKKGIIRDKKVHLSVLHDILGFITELDLSLLHLTYSPIKGGEGNIEFLVHIGYNEEVRTNVSESDIQAVVEAAHNQL